MTGWILSFGWNWALVPVAIWFARGIWVAYLRPELKYLSHTSFTKKVDFISDEERENNARYPSLYPKRPGGYDVSFSLITIKRQELLPPWRLLDETWLLSVAPTGATIAYLEGDGWQHYAIGKKLSGMMLVVQARAQELEDLSK